MLSGVDFIEIKDSTAWAIASKPDEDLIFFVPFNTNSEIRKK